MKPIAYEIYDNISWSITGQTLKSISDDVYHQVDDDTRGEYNLINVNPILNYLIEYLKDK